MDATSIQISKDVHKRLKILSVLNDKKLYQLIEEALIYLEAKYLHQNEEDDHENRM